MNKRHCSYLRRGNELGRVENQLNLHSVVDYVGDGPVSHFNLDGHIIAEHIKGEGVGEGENPVLREGPESFIELEIGCAKLIHFLDGNSHRCSAIILYFQKKLHLFID